jgi:nitrite reductase/ring-hydroxylating ferredoxin subunit
MSAEAPPPTALYARPEAFQRERRSVFEAAWLLLARVEQMRDPGSYVAQSLGGWPVFAIADSAGSLNGFRNVCRHQGLPVFDTGTGRCEEIRCRYHGWSYDASGRFRDAPAQSAPADPADPLHHLERVATATAHELLFVHLGQPASAPVLPALAAAGLDTLAFAGESMTDIDANWKLVVEAMLRLAPPDGVRALDWPTLIVDAVPNGVVIHQLIPRAFQRTRIQHHRYGGTVALELDAVRAAAVAAQTALLEMPAMPLDTNAAVIGFREQIKRAHPAG